MAGQRVHLFWRSALVEVHPRQPAGGRATDPADLPERQAHYALLDIGDLCRQADTHGPSVGIHARRLLEVDLPRTRMRQVYRLLGYARRYGNRRCDTACAQAVALDVVDVGSIGRIRSPGPTEATRRRAAAPMHSDYRCALVLGGPWPRRHDQGVGHRTSGASHVGGQPAAHVSIRPLRQLADRQSFVERLVHLGQPRQD